VKTSVVCPFYNEEEILEAAVRRLLAALERLEGGWELLLVDDGSTDGSRAIVERLAEEEQGITLLGYAPNRGRGYALRTGIAAARGELVVTTEIDLSWGEDIVERLVRAMDEHPEADIVVASPHLPGGAYRNVPARRVWASRLGNRVVRACMANAATMNTGMTRAYRREIIQSMPLYENRKEFHLEVILKATAFGLRVHEIPAVLEWQEYKHHGKRVARKSSSHVSRLIVSHSLFSLFANPVRYVWGIGLVSLALAIVLGVVAVVLKITGGVAAYTALLSILLLVAAMVLFVTGVVLKQGNMVQRELWTMQRDQLRARSRGSSRTSD
jgi:glycosyltransferase involved in cell wall biosynthesis